MPLFGPNADRKLLEELRGRFLELQAEYTQLYREWYECRTKDADVMRQRLDAILVSMDELFKDFKDIN